jgi:hypothetical protein
MDLVIESSPSFAEPFFNNPLPENDWALCVTQEIWESEAVFLVMCDPSMNEL